MPHTSDSGFGPLLYSETYGPTASSPTKWTSATEFQLQQWRFGTRSRVVIVAFGDSLGEATGAGSPGVPEDHGYLGLLQQALQREFGDGGKGFIGMWKPQWTRSGTWVALGGLSPFNGAYRTNAGDSVSSATLAGVVGDSLDIIYTDINASVGTFTATVDGGSPVTLTQAGLNDLKTKSVTLSLGSLGTHTVVIKGDTVGYLGLIGAAVYKGTGGAVLHNVAQSGFTAWGMTGGAANGTGVGNNSLALNLLDFLRPDLTLIQFGTNEYVNGQPLLTYQSAMSFIADRAKTAGRIAGDINGDVLIIVPPESSFVGGAAGSAGSVQKYSDSAKAAAAASGVPWVSIRDNWGPWAAASAAGRMNDSSHPNNKGYLDMAGLIWKLLRAA